MTKFEQDKINRKEIVDKICWLVDNLQKDQHFCLALNGEWGSGKSFVLEYIAEELHKHEEYIIVKYDAWKNSFYQDPLIAILYCIVDSVKEYFYYVDTTEKKFKKVAKFLKNSLQQFLNKVMGKVTESPDIETKRIAIGYYVVKKVAEIIKAVSANQILNHEKLSDFKSYQDLLKQAQDLLNEIADYEMYEKKRTKLIVLVDEIDRCLPDEQLKVLERLHHLFEVNNCVVICALNRDTIIKSFKHLYNNDGTIYLQKFFKYNFNIQTNSETYLMNAFNEKKDIFNQNLSADALLLVEDVDYIQRYVLNLYQSVSIRFDNRECTRYLELLDSVISRIDSKYINLYHLWFISVMIFYKLYSPSEFNEYLNGRTNSHLMNINSVSYRTNSDLTRTSSLPYNAFDKFGQREECYLDFYSQQEINNLLHMINQFLYRKTGGVGSLFTRYNMKVCWSEALMENIIKDINNLA